MKRTFALSLAALMLLGALAGCGSSNTSGSDQSDSTEPTKMTGTIDVVSREDGSGTRGAFVELLKITDADDNDATVSSAEIANSTAVAMSTVAGDQKAIGYISLGSLSSAVKAVKVDGAEATAENVKAGTYQVSRPFNIAYQESTLTDLGKDFLSFIMSSDGQKIINDNGYIAIDDAAPAYTGSGMSGQLSVAGSTSVSPLMEKLAEAYKVINPDVSIEIQQTGSTAGMTSAMEGACDIGMASRELKDSESAVLTSEVIAKDGIAVIVNNENPIDELTSEQIQQIYLGTITTWDELG